MFEMGQPSSLVQGIGIPCSQTVQDSYHGFSSLTLDWNYSTGFLRLQAYSQQVTEVSFHILMSRSDRRLLSGAHLPALCHSPLTVFFFLKKKTLAAKLQLMLINHFALVELSS